MRRLRPAPTLEDIAGWQDHARDLAAAARAWSPGRPGWEQVAAFVVSFEARQTSADPERRLVVEQVEQTPPEPRQEWPAWSREAAWTWMLERVEPAGSGASGTTKPVQRELAAEQPAAAAKPAGKASGRRPGQPGTGSRGSPGARRGNPAGTCIRSWDKGPARDHGRSPGTGAGRRPGPAPGRRRTCR
jgi:hypothetical protein